MEGRIREHIVRSSLPGRGGRLGCTGSWLAGSVRVSRRRGVGKVPWLGAVVHPLGCADCGRWWPAQRRVQPDLSSTVFRPRWAGWRPRCPLPGGRVRAIARASGCPGGPASAPPPESAEWRASGPEEWRRAYVGSWIVGCRRPFPGDCVLQSSPRSAASPPRSQWFDSAVGVRVGLLIPKATG
jgi:hypothetical protein